MLKASDPLTLDMSATFSEKKVVTYLYLKISNLKGQCSSPEVMREMYLQK